MEWGNPEKNILSYNKDLNTKYKKEWLEWDIETIATELKRDYKIEINDFDENKIQALKLVFANDLIWNDFLVFEKVGTAFNNSIPNFNHYEKLTPEEILIFLTLLSILKKKQFSEEIWSYVAVSLYENGYLVAIEEMAPAQKKLNQLSHYTQRDIDQLITGIKNASHFHEESIAAVQAEKNKFISIKAKRELNIGS